MQTNHVQTQFITLDGETVEVDEGMIDILNALKSLGIKTTFSCEDSMGRAYILMPTSSAKRLERIFRRGNFSTSTEALVAKFHEGRRTSEFSLYFGGDRGMDLRARLLFVKKHSRRNIFRVERVCDNKWGFRTVYRWPAHVSPKVLAALLEASQNKHGL